MRTSVQKPVLALMSAACIAAPAVVGAPHAAAAATPAISHSAVALSAEATLFDPVPAAARLVDLGVNGLDAADVTRLVDLLTFPYHNVYAVGSAVGSAANAGIQAVGLPLSLGYYYLTNQQAKIPAYVDGVQTNVNNAIPNIIKAINAEIAYDQALFAEFFGGSSTTATAGVRTAALAAPTAGISASAADVTRLVDLLTFPYHNVYAVGSAVGSAANAGIQVLGLPLSLGYYYLTNQQAKIPTYLDGVQTNVNNAIPNIIKAINTEIAYDQALFADFFGGSTATTNVQTQALTAPTDGIQAAALAPTAGLAASTGGLDLATLVDLATFPYHNVYAVGSAVGSAANAGIQVLGLPLSLGYYYLTNQQAKIPTYLDGVQTNVNNAIPNIVKAINTEIAYDQKLFAKVFGGGTVSAGTNVSTATSQDKVVTLSTVAPDAVEGSDAPKAITPKAGDDQVKTVEEDKTTEPASDQDAAAPKPKKDVAHFDLAAAVKALGGSLNGIGKHAPTGKQDDVTKDDSKKDDVKKDDTKKDDTKTDDAKKGDAGQGAANGNDGGDSGQTGGRHRAAE